jgi:hypothetical protein
MNSPWLITYLFNRFPDSLRVTYLLQPFLSFQNMKSPWLIAYLFNRFPNPLRVIKRPFATVPFISEYEEPLTNSKSVQQISRSAPCNISFASVPFFLEYEEPLNNKEAFCNRPDQWEVRTYKLSSYVQVRYPSQWSHGAERIGELEILKNRFPDLFLSNSISNRFLVPFRVIKRYFPLPSDFPNIKSP